MAIEVELDPGVRRVLAGFENHGGRTHLGPKSTPFGRVLKGHGNNGADGFEGVRDGNVIGTYLHGPLLPKNAWFADWLIADRPRAARPARAARRPARGRRSRGGAPGRRIVKVVRLMARGASLTAGRIGSALACALAAAGLAGCGGAGSRADTPATAGTADAPSTTTVTSPATTTVTTTTTTTTTTTETVTLPGEGKPPVTIGDENTPEQFMLGQLYYQALKAEGFPVSLNQSIGPTQVILQALATGQLGHVPRLPR